MQHGTLQTVGDIQTLIDDSKANSGLGSAFYCFNDPELFFPGNLAYEAKTLSSKQNSKQFKKQ